MKTTFYNLIVILFLVAIGCNSREEAPATLAVRKMSSSEFRSAPAEANVDEMLAAGEPSSVGAYDLLARPRFSQAEPNIIKSPQTPNRMLIKTATLNCEVAKYTEEFFDLTALGEQTKSGETLSGNSRLGQNHQRYFGSRTGANHCP